MLIEKVQDNIALLKNLNKGDIMMFSKKDSPSDINISPENIYWVDYSDSRGVSLKSFSKGSKFINYSELEQVNFWYLLQLSFYIGR